MSHVHGPTSSTGRVPPLSRRRQTGEATYSPKPKNSSPSTHHQPPSSSIRPPSPLCVSATVGFQETITGQKKLPENSPEGCSSSRHTHPPYSMLRSRSSTTMFPLSSLLLGHPAITTSPLLSPPWLAAITIGQEAIQGRRNPLESHRFNQPLSASSPSTITVSSLLPPCHRHHRWLDREFVANHCQAIASPPESLFQAAEPPLVAVSHLHHTTAIFPV